MIHNQILQSHKMASFSRKAVSPGCVMRCDAFGPFGQGVAKETKWVCLKAGNGRLIWGNRYDTLDFAVPQFRTKPNGRNGCQLWVSLQAVHPLPTLQWAITCRTHLS